MKTLNLTYFFDTEATITSKNYVIGPASDLVSNPQVTTTVLGTLQPIDATKIRKDIGGQDIINATDMFYTNENPQAQNGDVATINGTNYEVTGYENPSISVLGSYYALYLLEQRD